MALLFEVSPLILTSRSHSCVNPCSAGQCHRRRESDNVSRLIKPKSADQKESVTYFHMNHHKSQQSADHKELVQSPSKDMSREGLSLDMAGFSPDEIRVKVKDRTVTVDARHEEGHKDSGSYVLREMRRRLTLPSEVDPRSAICEMTPEGLLHLKTPRSDQQEDSMSVDIVREEGNN